MEEEFPMGLFSGILGNASNASTESVERDLEKIMLDDEKVEHAYKLIRDLIVFTNRRLILVDKQGISGKKQNTILSLIKVLHNSALKQLGILI